MKQVHNMAAQGDLLVRRIDRLPDNITPVAPAGGVFTVAHSETGHNHVVEATRAVTMFDSPDPLVSYLAVVESADEVETIIRHMRSFDTHEALGVPPGIYEIRRQREYTPEGFRRAAD